MSAATAGRAREHLVRDDLTDRGWTFIMRAAGSKGPADLALAHPDHGLALVQVGAKSKALGPADRNRLVDACELAGALPILAISNRGITYWQVDRGLPGQWAPWSPGARP